MVLGQISRTFRNRDHHTFKFINLYKKYVRPYLELLYRPRGLDTAGQGDFREGPEESSNNGFQDCKEQLMRRSWRSWA
jgi:hypothetical protein